MFPAAILQPPFFDLAARSGDQLRRIGAVIGHEMGHGFDDQGAKFDGDGNLRNWWTAEDNDQLQGRRTRALWRTVFVLRAAARLNVNGELTLGENIGDLSGAAVSYAAYVHSLNGAEAPVIDGYTGRQRFFLGYAQSWRTKWREGLMREVVLTDPHSPSEFRSNGVVSNMDEFYAAFGVREGDKLWRPAAERVKVW